MKIVLERISPPEPGSFLNVDGVSVPFEGREVVLDTETTGLDVHWETPHLSHRIIEVACQELMHRIPTGRVFHCYVNPGRSVPAEATAVHGLTETFLKDHPPFSHIAADLVTFLGKSPLVIHNASFDMKFLTYELRQMYGNGYKLSNPVVDTLTLARKQFPGSPASLDALCRRFQISLQDRNKHGALIDTHLLSQVYLEMTGGLQPKLQFSQDETEQQTSEIRVNFQASWKRGPARLPRTFDISEEDQQIHQALLLSLKKALS